MRLEHWLYTIPLRLRSLFRGSAVEHELDEELRYHLDRQMEDNAVRGLSPAQARQAALRAIDGVEQRKEECRDMRRVRFIEDFFRDLVYAFRVLRRSPAFTTVALLSLALGIGANTVVFSVFYSLILKPLPVAHPAQLFFVEGAKFSTHSFPNYRAFRDRNTALSDVIGSRLMMAGLDSGGEARRVWGYLATGNYFDALGVKPAVGRFFHPEDDVKPGASPYAVLSYACWKSRFGGDRNIVGKTVRINAMPYTILGVAQPGFHGTELFFWPEIWVPMMMQPQIEGHSWLDQPATFNTWVTVRLKPGVTAGQAEAELNSIAASLAREDPTWNEGLKVKLTKPGLIGDAMRQPAKAFTGGVLTLSCLVLLAACVNLASLLAARAADRGRELAIRLSLGAGRKRIARQLLTEAFLLSVLGGTAGCALAVLLLRLLTQWHAPLDFPVQFEVSPDARVFAVAAAVSLLTGLLFGLAPARQAWRADPQQALKSAPEATGRGRRWAFRDALLVVQVALCCTLVTGCFVSLRGLSRAFQTPLGFRAAGVSVVGFDLGLAHYSEKDAREFQRRALEAVSQLPGVTSAAYSNSVPLSIDQSSTVVFDEHETDRRPARSTQATYYQVSPGYFDTMGTRLLAGRDLTWHDDKDAPKVAVVNVQFARKVYGTPDAVGRRFVRGGGDPITVVGLVEDGKYTSLTEDARPVVFLPALQEYNSTTDLLVRAAGPSVGMAQAMQSAIARLDPRLPQYGAGTLQQMLGFAFFPAQAATIALGAFGVLAVMLAFTGIYGLAAYAVSRRVREIGIRVAIGAGPTQILKFVLGRTALLLGAGSCVGLMLGFASARLLASIVYQASARDPEVLVGVTITMIVIGLAAAWAPARRSLSVDPLIALRHE